MCPCSAALAKLPSVIDWVMHALGARKSRSSQVPLPDSLLLRAWLVAVTGLLGAALAEMGQLLVYKSAAGCLVHAHLPLPAFCRPMMAVRRMVAEARRAAPSSSSSPTTGMPPFVSALAMQAQPLAIPSEVFMLASAEDS